MSRDNSCRTAQLSEGLRYERILILVLAGLTLCADTSCSATYPTGPGTPPHIVGVQIQYPGPTPDPRVGRTMSLVAYSVDSDGAWADVTSQAAWYTTDSSIVRTSTGSGTLLAVGEGTTTVIASYGGATESIAVTVRPASPTYPQLEFTNLGQNATGAGGATLTRRLSLTGISTQVTSLATWTSSNPAVAIVRVANPASAGFTPVATGNTRITATLDGQSASLGFSVPPRR